MNTENTTWKDIILKDGSTGKYYGECVEGEIITIQSHDENGMPIEITGKVSEIIEK